MLHPGLGVLVTTVPEQNKPRSQEDCRALLALSRNLIQKTLIARPVVYSFTCLLPFYRFIQVVAKDIPQ